MSESSGNKIEIHTEGGTVIAGGTFTNVEFVANKYVYGGCGQEPEAGAQTTDAEAEAGMPVAVIPPQLDTEPARNLLRRLMQAGMLDEDWQPADLSNAEKGILAWLLARRLKIENQWQTFSALWGMKTETLRTAYNRGMDQRRTGQFMERVKKVMGEPGEEI